MHNMIQDGPPDLRSLNTNNHADTREARVPILVDGYAAEFRVELNTKEQRYSTYKIVMFEPVTLSWITILNWGMTEVGHLNTYPEPELITALRSIGEVMWSYANVVVGQSSRRQEEVEIKQYVDERLAYEDATYDDPQTLGDDATALVRNEHTAQVEAEYAASAASFDAQVEVLNADR